MNKPAVAIKGFVKVDVIDHTGKVVREGDWQPNLLLDQGLNRLAAVSFCDLFNVAVKGTDTVKMREGLSVGGGGTTIGKFYHTTNAGGTSGVITRLGAGRDFVSTDVGRLVQDATADPSNNKQAIIQSITSTTAAVTRQIGTNLLVAWANNITAHEMFIYSNQVTGMATEAARTQTYSATDTDNFTKYSGPTATLQRAFIFDPEPEHIDGGIGMASWSGTTVLITVGRALTSADEGGYLEFSLNGSSGFEQTVFCKIQTVVNGTTATADRTAPSPPVPSSFVKFYSYASYSHIGFSDTMTVGANLNILVRLSNSTGAAVPVKALGDNPETPGQQVKATYQMIVTFGPSGKTAVTGLFAGTPGDMSGDRSGHYAIEAIETSMVSPDGTTDTSNTALEPYAGGAVALSPSKDTLLPLTTTTTGAPDRSDGAQWVPMTNDPYVADKFTIGVSGTFGPNDAPADTPTWWSFGIFDVNNSRFLLTYLFDNLAQKKPSTHQLSLHFTKTWNRDLSI